MHLIARIIAYMVTLAYQARFSLLSLCSSVARFDTGDALSER